MTNEDDDGKHRWKAIRVAAAPRHRYIPDTVWIDNDGNGPTLLPLHRDGYPERWLELAYADDAVIIQINDGRPQDRVWVQRCRPARRRLPSWSR